MSHLEFLRKAYEHAIQKLEDGSPLNEAERAIIIAGVQNREEQIATLERKNQELTMENASLEQKIETDDLTGLLNKRGFDGRLQYSCDAAQKENYQNDILVLAFDCDRFKLYNDRYGHPSGDHLLKIIGNYLRQQFQIGDRVARIGGDEFYAIAYRVHAKENELSDRSINDRLSQMVTDLPAVTHVVDPSGIVTLSVGATFLSKHCRGGDALQYADDAMYYAKFTGAGHHLWDAAKVEEYDRIKEEIIKRRLEQGISIR
jgi:diguanylate cyclase (GGDEF)-like protein